MFLKPTFLLKLLCPHPQFRFLMFSISSLRLVLEKVVRTAHSKWDFLFTAFLFSDVGIQIWLKKWCLFKKNLYLEYNCFAMWWYFLPYSKMNQPYVYIDPLFFGFYGEQCGGSFKKLKIELSWSNNPAPGHIPGGNHSKGYIHANVYCSTIYNS